MFDHDDIYDPSKVKEVEVGDKKFRITITDPFGFCYISLPKGGKVPNDLSGAYTTVDDAKRGIQAYVNKKQKEEDTPKDKPGDNMKRAHGKPTSREEESVFTDNS